MEVESIAYVVSNVLGIDTSSYSFGYVGGWSKDKELTQLKSSLNTIQKTAHDLISNIGKGLLILQRNRENDLNISLYDGEVDLDRIKEENIEKLPLSKKFEKAQERAKKVNKFIEAKHEITKEIGRR